MEETLYDVNNTDKIQDLHNIISNMKNDTIISNMKYDNIIFNMKNDNDNNTDKIHELHNIISNIRNDNIRNNMKYDTIISNMKNDKIQKLHNTKIKKKHTFSKFKTKMLIRRYITKIKISDKKLQKNIDTKIKKLHSHYNKIIFNLKKDFNNHIKSIIFHLKKDFDNHISIYICDLKIYFDNQININNNNLRKDFDNHINNDNLRQDIDNHINISIDNLKIYFDNQININNNNLRIDFDNHINNDNLKTLNKPKPVYKRWLEYELLHRYHMYDNMEEDNLINTLTAKWDIFRDKDSMIHQQYSMCYYKELYILKMLDICKNIEFTDTPLSLLYTHHIFDRSTSNCWTSTDNGMEYIKKQVQPAINYEQELNKYHIFSYYISDNNVGRTDNKIPFNDCKRIYNEYPLLDNKHDIYIYDTYLKKFNN
jgi:hypothetical protein